MSIEQRLKEIAETRLGIACAGAREIAYQSSPLDLGPLRDAIVVLDPLWEGNTIVSGIEWGAPDVTRQRGYYPGVLNMDARYGHAGFVTEIADEIKAALPSLLTSRAFL
jgi:hypothetical protein